MLILLPTTYAFAEEPTLNSGDTAWMIMSTALVMIMTPAGLALFYGGMSRYKNLLNTFAMTFMSYCLASVIWVVIGSVLTHELKIQRSGHGFVANFRFPAPFLCFCL